MQVLKSLQAETRRVNLFCNFEIPADFDEQG